MVEVIHARAPGPLDPSTLQGVAPEAFAGASFVRSEAAILLHLEHPANAFLQACMTSGAAPSLPSPGPAATVVYRSGAVVWRMDLTPAMARVLGALLDGATIADALEQMAAGPDDAPALAEAERSVMIWFREWVSGGLFAELRFPAAALSSRA
jgi:hypothetical protein